MLGVAALRGPDTWPTDLSDDDRRECDEAGFEVASKGAEGIGSLVDNLHAAYRKPGRKQGPSRVLGSLYQWLSFKNLDPAYDPVKDAVRSRWLELVPMEAGERLLGRVVQLRAVHSIRSASRTFGISRTILRRILRAKGLIGPETDALPDTKVTFNADSAFAVLEQATGVMTLEEAGIRLGMPQAVREIAVDKGLLVPWIKAEPGHISRHVFRQTDVESFNNTLQSIGRPETQMDASLLTLPAAARLLRHDQVVIALLVFDGKLRHVGIRSGEPAYRSILVDPEEVKAVLRPSSVHAVSRTEAARSMSVTKSVVIELIRIGALQSYVDIHPVTKRRQPLIATDELRRFQREIVSLQQVASCLGRGEKAVRPLLASKGVDPVYPPDTLGKHLYRRRDVNRIGIGPY